MPPEQGGAPCHACFHWQADRCHGLHSDRSHMPAFHLLFQEIAREKAGIFKPEAAAYTVPQPDDALAALRDKASEAGVPLVVVRDFDAFRLAHSLGDSTEAWVSWIKDCLAGAHRERPPQVLRKQTRALFFRLLQVGRRLQLDCGTGWAAPEDQRSPGTGPGSRLGGALATCTRALWRRCPGSRSECTQRGGAPGLRSWPGCCFLARARAGKHCGAAGCVCSCL